ncbi:transcriptional regulator [Methanobrevibacter sp. OttesenSCG-928-K11]|nr:transcriptional regulator [Methanobrevibacter sp. OttesenSCG-928-K11]
MNQEYLLDLAANILISSYRLKVLESIGDEFKMPSKIAEDTGIRTNHISKVLSDLKDKKIVECINEDARKGRLYKTTDLGKEVYKCIKSGKIN